MDFPKLSSTSHASQQHHHLLPFERFEVIEPGSELYIDMGPDFDYCLDTFDGISIMEQQELLISENEIPQEVLEDVFRMDDEIQETGGVIPTQYPVADGLSMKEYENQLEAEMEELFPEVNATQVLVQPSRLKEELVKTSSFEKPCYMSVSLRSEGARKERRHISTAPRDTRRGFRCVEMIDGSGTAFKAKFYDHIPSRRFTPVPPLDISAQHRRVAELLQSTTLQNISPEMASKIETLASGKRDVTLAKVRTSDIKNTTTTIVIKTPKRTIASGGTSVEPPSEFSLPMTVVKKDPSFDATPIEVPVIVPTPVNNKQPRKQKLQSLSQCEVVFNEGTNSTATTVSRSRGPPTRKPVPRSRAHPPNDFVTVTITDVTSSAKKQPSQPIRSSVIPAANWIKIPPSNQAERSPTKAYPFRKRSLVTHYRIQMTPNNNRVSGQSVESIEILDTTDEETDTSGIPAPETAVKEIPKLPGNTESIQCPFCCKVFFSSHGLMLHGQHCADAVMFGNSPPKDQQSPRQKATKGGSTEKAKPSLPLKARPNRPPILDPKKNRLSRAAAAAAAAAAAGSSTSGSGKVVQRRTTSRLSIEILSSGFNIENLLLCNVCQKTFRSQDHLTVHQNIHKTPTVCQFCKKKFYGLLPKHTCQEMKRSKLRE